MAWSERHCVRGTIFILPRGVIAVLKMLAAATASSSSPFAGLLAEGGWNFLFITSARMPGLWRRTLARTSLWRSPLPMWPARSSCRGSNARLPGWLRKQAGVRPAAAVSRKRGPSTARSGLQEKLCKGAPQTQICCKAPARASALDNTAQRCSKTEQKPWQSSAADLNLDLRRLLEKAIQVINEMAKLRPVNLQPKSREDFEAPDQDLMAAVVDLPAAVVEGLQADTVGLLRQSNSLCVLMKRTFLAQGWL